MSWHCMGLLLARHLLVDVAVRRVSEPRHEIQSERKFSEGGEPSLLGAHSLVDEPKDNKHETGQGEQDALDISFEDLVDQVKNQRSKWKHCKCQRRRPTTVDNETTSSGWKEGSICVDHEGAMNFLLGAVEVAGSEEEAELEKVDEGANVVHTCRIHST